METKIDNILEDYTIEAPERTIQRVAAEAINNIIDTNITSEAVRYQQGTLWVDTDPLIRSQIHIHQEDIRSTITDRIKKRRIDDIH